MTVPGQLEHAAIQFTIECLQESDRRSGYFPLSISCICICIHSNSIESDIITKYPMWNQMDISLIAAEVLQVWSYSLFKDVILNMFEKIHWQFEPIAIQFMLECLQDSTRQSGCFPLVNF